MMNVPPTLFGAALGVPEKLPVGRLVTGCLKPLWIDKCFETPKRRIKMTLPVTIESPHAFGKKMRSQMGDVNPVRYQETRVVGNSLQMEFPLLVRPSNEFISITKP